MNGHWGLATYAKRWCGFDTGHEVPVGAVVYFLAGKILRCELHAPVHALEDTAGIARASLAAESSSVSEGQAAPPRLTRQGGRTTKPASLRTGDFASFAQTVAPAQIRQALEKRGVRVTPPNKPQPFASVANVRDPKAHAFND